MFSQTAEYALRAIVCLAQNSDTSLTTQQIAEMTRVPPGYLSKVLQSLARAKLVSSQRGIGGGFTLLKEPDEVSILDVLDIVDPIRRIKTCPLGLKSHGTHLCPLHRRIDDATAMLQKAFAETSIADLLREPSRSTPLCEMTVKGARA